MVLGNAIFYGNGFSKILKAVVEDTEVNGKALFSVIMYQIQRDMGLENGFQPLTIWKDAGRRYLEKTEL